MDHPTFGSLRRHQGDSDLLAGRVISGEYAMKVATANVCPGGGKTLMASIFAHRLLYAGLIDRVCWVCPRSSLREQVAHGFNDAGRGLDFKLRAASNVSPLVRDTESGVVGYATTYQSIATNPSVHAAEFKAHRYLLIPDEVHHLAEQREWLLGMTPLFEMAIARGFVLALSGTIVRHDNLRIPYIGYTNANPPQPDCQILYTRPDALAEKAVLPLSIEMQDGVSTYAVKGKRSVVTLSESREDEQTKALRTALESPEYRNAILVRMMDDFLSYRGRINYATKGIVIAHDQDAAKECAAFIDAKYKAHGIKTALAISDEKDAQSHIRSFRLKRTFDVLVTCAMAHEGLDVPEATHMALLTLIRSIPWNDQAIARITRFDPKRREAYEGQYAFLYTPDDPAMRKIVQSINEEQRACHPPPVKMPRGTQARGPARPEVLEVIDGVATGVSYAEDGHVYTPEQVAIIEQYKDVFKDIPYPQIVRAIEQRDEQTAKRSLIQQMTNERDERLHLPPGSTNKTIFQKFGVPREKMSLQGLDDVIAFINALRSDAA